MEIWELCSYFILQGDAAGAALRYAPKISQKAIARSLLSISPSLKKGGIGKDGVLWEGEALR